MDETIKIYSPGKVAMIQAYENATKVKSETKKKSRSKESMAPADILADVLDERKQREQKLMNRHPWVPILYNWFIAIMAILFALSLVNWGIQIRTQRQAASLTAVAMADWQAEQDAIEAKRIAEEQALKNSEENICKNMAMSLSRVFYGIRNFESKYNYGTEDYRTYAWCIFNRVDNPAYPNTLDEVILQKDQWVGFAVENPSVDQYYTMALKFVKEWRNAETRPVTTDYLWAELTEKGIYLRNSFKADGYAVRWKAT